MVSVASLNGHASSTPNQASGIVAQTNSGVIAARRPVGKERNLKEQRPAAEPAEDRRAGPGELRPWRANHHAAATTAHARIAPSNQHHAASELAYAGRSAAANFRRADHAEQEQQHARQHPAAANGQEQREKQRMTQQSHNSSRAKSVQAKPRGYPPGSSREREKSRNVKSQLSLCLPARHRARVNPPAAAKLPEMLRVTILRAGVLATSRRPSRD